MQLGAHRLAELASQRPLVDGVGDPGLARGRVRERLDEHVAEQEDPHAVGAQQVGEGVVLDLGALHPGDAVEEQAIGVARGQALELGAGAVQDDRAQRADLGVHVRRIHGRRP